MVFDLILIMIFINKSTSNITICFLVNLIIFFHNNKFYKSFIDYLYYNADNFKNINDIKYYFAYFLYTHSSYIFF